MTDRWRDDPDPIREASRRVPPRRLFRDSWAAPISTAIALIVVLVLVAWAIVSFNAPGTSTTNGTPARETSQPAPPEPPVAPAKPEPAPAQQECLTKAQEVPQGLAQHLGNQAKIAEGIGRPQLAAADPAAAALPNGGIALGLERRPAKQSSAAT